MNELHNSQNPLVVSRRNFLKSSSKAVAGSALLSSLAIERFAHGAISPSDTVRIALVGCGGRGSGAASQALSTTGPIKLIAVADAFKDQADRGLNQLKAKHEDKIDVPEDHKFIGFDAYKQAIQLADVVILATPPGFRPIHFEEAIRQGKHVFMEKPVATDPAGIKKVLEVAAEAKKKKLNVVVGLQRHYQNSYRELYKRVKDGAIGEITSGQVWWNNDGVWVKMREPSQTEMEYQMRNWYYFNWLCGDHINEQHIHNIDVMNWFKGAYPVKAQGMGGRQVRTGKEYGEIYDHHFVEFHYADGTILNSQCRHQKGTYAIVDEMLVGTKGVVKCGDAQIIKKGKVSYQYDKKLENNPYQTEHDELFAAIAKGEFKFEDADRVARSTMTSILGRMATYSGEVVEWDKA